MTNNNCQHFEDTDCNEFLNCCDCGYSKNRGERGKCCPYCWTCNACDNCYAERED